MDVCGGCNKAIKGKAVECSICKLWFEMKCSGVDEASANFLLSPAGQKSSIHWYCKSCDSSSKKLHEMVTAANDRMTVIEQKVDQITEALKNLSVKLENAISTRDAVTSQQNPQTNVPSQTIMVSEIANELKEREKRALNVVFSGAENKEKVIKFIKAGGFDEPTKITEITTQSKKQLFIVTMKTESVKWALIGKARRLSNINDDLKNIFVNPDLTKSERNLQFKLREEVRHRRSLGESVKISKGKVVTIKP